MISTMLINTYPGITSKNVYYKNVLKITRIIVVLAL